MAIEHAEYFYPDFPEKVWDGLSPEGAKYHPFQLIQPNKYDYAKISAEVIALEKYALELAGNPTTTSIAGANFPARTWVHFDDSGRLIPSNNDANRVVGLSKEAGTLSEPCTAQTLGLVTHEGWNLTPQAAYYLWPNGVMSVDVPQTGHIIKLGVAISADQFVINIQHIVNLGE